MQRIGPWTATLVLAALAPAQQIEPQMAMAAPAEPAPLQEVRSLRLGSGHVRSALSALSRGLDWHGRLRSAAKEARAKGRPILWIQALGNLRGFA